jgi:GNAT superfamily N-acetyltransferase
MIRRAVPDDALDVARTHIAAWRETYAGLVSPETVEASTRWEDRASLWVDRFATGDRSIFVVETAGRIVGLACAVRAELVPPRRPLIAGYDAYLEALYLLREVQGAGFGRALVRTIAVDAMRRGMAGLSLHVLATNPSRAFYEHTGAVWVRDEPAGPHSGTYQCAYAWPDLEQLAARLA